MKPSRIFLVAAVAAIATTNAAAQTEQKANLSADSLTIQLRLRQLQQDKAALARRIETEDGKRNQNIAGISPENLDIMNTRQDSLCLALRSEMTDIDLEIAEQKKALQTAAAAPATQPTAEATADPGSPTQQPLKPNKVQQAINAINNRPNRPNRK